MQRSHTLSVVEEALLLVDLLVDLPVVVDDVTGAEEVEVSDTAVEEEEESEEVVDGTTELLEELTTGTASQAVMTLVSSVIAD